MRQLTADATCTGGLWTVRVLEYPFVYVKVEDFHDLNRNVAARMRANRLIGKGAEVHVTIRRYLGGQTVGGRLVGDAPHGRSRATTSPHA